MRAILAELLGARIWDEVSIDDLLHTEIVETDKRGRPIGVEPSYELRYREFGASQLGIVGHMTHGMFRDWVDLMLANILTQLQQEQPSCEWVLVGALVDQVNLRTVVPVPFRGSRQGTSDRAVLRTIADHDEEDTTTVYALDRKTSYEERADYRWRVRTIWADRAKGELVDPNVHLGAHPGPMTKYIEGGRQLRMLTENMRQVRRKCESSLREYETRLRELKDEWDDVRGAFGRTAPVAQAAPDITPHQVAAAFELRKQGLNMALIAQAMGVDAVKLELLVTRHLEAVIAAEEHKAHIEATRDKRFDESDSERLAAHADSVTADPDKPRPSRRKIP